HRYTFGVRLPDALRPRPRLSGADDQEIASQVDHPRTALVPRGRHQYPISQRPWRHHLGRMGRRERRTGPGLWKAVALLAGWPWRFDRPDRESFERDTAKSSIAEADRLGLESG